MAEQTIGRLWTDFTQRADKEGWPATRLLGALLERPVLTHAIIGIVRKETLRKVPLHPCVKCIMHEQIHQDWADHPALRCTSHPWQPVLSQ